MSRTLGVATPTRKAVDNLSLVLLPPLFVQAIPLTAIKDAYDRSLRAVQKRKKQAQSTLEQNQKP